MKKIFILLTLLLLLSGQSIYAYDNKVNSIVNTKIISQEGQANKEDLILYLIFFYFNIFVKYLLILSYKK